MINYPSKTLFHNIKFLVVDDEPDNLNVIVKIISHLGGNVVGASSGKEALEVVLLQKPDVIVMDIAMPEMDGYKLLKRLKENPETTHIPTIALTALAMIGDRERILEAGFDDYMSKPIYLPVFITDMYEKLHAIPEIAKLLNSGEEEEV